MPTLNDATAVYVGTTPAQAVYLGDVKVWPSAVASPYVDWLTQHQPRAIYGHDMAAPMLTGGATNVFVSANPAAEYVLTDNDPAPGLQSYRWLSGSPTFATTFPAHTADFTIGLLAYLAEPIPSSGAPTFMFLGDGFALDNENNLGLANPWRRATILPIASLTPRPAWWLIALSVATGGAATLTAVGPADTVVTVSAATITARTRADWTFRTGKPRWPHAVAGAFLVGEALTNPQLQQLRATVP